LVDTKLQTGFSLEKTKKKWPGSLMMIFYKERLAYLAVPKTGTTSIEHALQHRASMILRDPPGLKHTNARRYERRFRALFEPGDLGPVETVAVFREPVSWLSSWFRYRQRDALKGHPNSTFGLSFDQFVEAYLSETSPPYADLGSQGRFVTDDNGELLVQHLFQFEDLPTFVNFLENRLGEPVQQEKRNMSAETPVTLSDELEQELRRAYALDFQIHAALAEGPLSIG
jgi:hypothetical protein